MTRSSIKIKQKLVLLKLVNITKGGSWGLTICITSDCKNVPCSTGT